MKIYKDCKFIYFSHSTLQVPRVARQCMVSLCEAVAQLGADSEIVSFKKKMDQNEPAHPKFEKLYGITTPIKNTTYWLIDIKLKPVFQFQRLFLYTFRVMKGILNSEFRYYRHVILTARNYSVLTIMVFIKMMFKQRFIVVADVHGLPKSSFQMWVHKNVDGNICISKSLLDDLTKKLKLSKDKARFAHNGVKINRFMLVEGKSKSELRNNLGLPNEKFILCYVGKVYYRYEEVGYFLKAAKYLNNEFLILIVGGRPDQVNMWEKERINRNVSNVIFRSFVLPSQIPDYMKASDLLIMYYSPSPLNDYRSPGKLFEYLASGTPVLAGRFRSTEEIIRDGEIGFLVEPYQPRLLAEKVKKIILDKELLEHVGLNARRRAEEFTWRNRGQCFLEYGMNLSDKSNS